MEFFKQELEELKTKGLFRSIKNIEKTEGKYIYIDGKKYLDLSSSNYLGLRDDSRVKEEVKKAIDTYGFGSGASRLVCGTADVYTQLEDYLKTEKKQEAALFFNSGYDANLGIISSIIGKNDVVFCDKLNHASIYDGIFLSGAKLIRYKHNDVLDLKKKLLQHRDKYQKAMIVTDTLFSMDGDFADLKAILELKEQHKAIFMIDEAHAGGVFGESGMGLAEYENILQKIDINMGTFSKAYGGQGAYVCASKLTVEYLINKSRSLIYTTAIPPAVAAGNLIAMRIAKEESWRRKKLLDLVAYLREGIGKLGLEIVDGESQIIPIICKSNEMALKLSGELYKKGIFVPAIRKPTVNQPRLRVSLGALLGIEDLEFFLEELEKALGKFDDDIEVKS